MSNQDKYHKVVQLLHNNGVDDLFEVADEIWDILELKHPYEEEEESK